MKTLRKQLHLLLVLTTICTIATASQSFSKADVMEDFIDLRESLESTHYNLFAYTPESEFDVTFENLKLSISKESYSLLEVINLYQKLVSKVNNGHTEIDFPVAPYLDYAESGGTLFPLELAIEQGRAFVRKNYSSDASIPLGSEIVSINGILISEVIARIHPQISAERIYFKNAKLEALSFPRYYWQVFGRQDTFEVEIQSQGSLSVHRFDAVDVFSGYEELRTEVLGTKRELKNYDEFAYLNPGPFSGDFEEFKTFVADSVQSILDKRSEVLIVDLRNNSGGNEPFSDYLISYIADKPFKWCSRFSLKTSKLLKEDTRKNRDLSNPFWKSVLEYEDGTLYPYVFDPVDPQPKGKRFAGKVYVLVNRQSHSQSAVAAAQIQDYGWATIVGEETGDFPTLYASQFHFTLPRTGVIVKISKGYIVRVNGSEKPEGVIPDIVIKDHLMDDKDEILDGLLKRLRKAQVSRSK